jgi:DtxR family Mn-dependent transcriptional regulator
MTVRESGEMYLEAILVLAKKSGYVRSIDVSEYLGYSKPSVSRAMGILREGGYILVEKDGAITLTDSGKKLAETIYERHTVLSDLLIRLGVDEKTATDDACRIEHVISDESFQAIKQYYYQHNPGGAFKRRLRSSIPAVPRAPPSACSRWPCS